jgi:hypothetical protein
LGGNLHTSLSSSSLPQKLKIIFILLEIAFIAHLGHAIIILNAVLFQWEILNATIFLKSY